MGLSILAKVVPQEIHNMQCMSEIPGKGVLVCMDQIMDFVT